jgi:hypothetical protein
MTNRSSVPGELRSWSKMAVIEMRSRVDNNSKMSLHHLCRHEQYLLFCPLFSPPLSPPSLGLRLLQKSICTASELSVLPAPAALLCSVRNGFVTHQLKVCSWSLSLEVYRWWFETAHWVPCWKKFFIWAKQADLPVLEAVSLITQHPHDLHAAYLDLESIWIHRWPAINQLLNLATSDSHFICL